MRKLLTALTSLTLVGGVSLGAPATAMAADHTYWISTAAVGDGTSCSEPTHQYDQMLATKQFNDLLDDILDDVSTHSYSPVTIAICAGNDSDTQRYTMDADTDPLVDVSGAEITIVGVQWDATSEADVAGAGDVVIVGNDQYSPFEFNNADVYIGYLTI